MSGSSLCPRFLLGLRFAADHLHHIGTRGYLARDAQVFQGHRSAFEMDADEIQEENAKMTDCYFETKDWRACKKEVRHLSRHDSFNLHVQLLIMILDGDFPRVLETPGKRKEN